MLVRRPATAPLPRAHRLFGRLGFLGGLLAALVGGCPTPDAGLPTGEPNSPGETPTVVEGITIFEPGGGSGPGGGGGDPDPPATSNDAQDLRFSALPATPPNAGVELSIRRTDGSTGPSGEYRWLFDGPERLETSQTGPTQTLLIPEAGVYTVRCWLVVSGVAFTVLADSPADPIDALDMSEITVPPTLSGFVFDQEGAALAGVKVTIDGTSLSVDTGSDGSFALAVPSGTSGTLRPSKSSYTFTPETWAFANLVASRGNLIFRGTGSAAPDNDPLADAVSASTKEEVAAVITLAGADPQGASLSFLITQLPSHGSLQDLGTGQTISAGQLPYRLNGAGREVRYAPSADYFDASVADTFQYRVDNGQKQSAPATVSVSVRGVNDEPSFVLPDSPSNLRAGQTALLTMQSVSPGPSNESSQTVTFSATSSDAAVLPASNISISGATVSITPIAAGPVTLTITARDDGGTSEGGDDASSQSLGLNIGWSNPPSADARTLLVHRNTPKTIYLTGRDQAGYSSLEPLGQTLTFSVVANPSHGTLHGTPPNIVYVPTTNYTGADSFTFKSNDGYSDSDPATITLNVADFAPPVGTPDPGFGISEQASWPAGWPSAAVTGSYYIDNTHPAATDTANTYGYPDKPRKTIPWPMPLTAGAVVEIAGGPYDSAPRFKITGGGAAGNPAYVRGPSATARPHLRNSLDVYAGGGGYIIIENIKLTGALDLCAGYGHHVAVRNSEFTGKVGGGSVLAVSGDTSGGNQTHDIVIYNNLIRDNGDWLADFDEDAHGIGVVYYTNNIWIIDNEFFHNSGNGVQVNAGQVVWESTTHHVYVSRNEAHHNKQAGIWSKLGHDIVFSQNRCYASRPVGEHPSNYGDGMGGQYAPDNLWYLFNEIYDCSNGIRLSESGGGATAGTGQNIYMIGNLIYDIHHTTVDLTGQYPVVGGTDFSPTDPWAAGRGIAIWHATATKHVINNTIFDVDTAISVVRQNNAFEIENNIFANLHDQLDGDTPHILIEHDSSAALGTLRNNVFDNPARIKWGYPATVQGIAVFESGHSSIASGNIETDWTTLFVDPDHPDSLDGGLALRLGSPAVGMGALNSAYATFQALYGIDISIAIDGTARPTGGTWDTGAYER